ncbi:MAG: SpoIID/LytB domain-containing protein [Solirubrobacterales bacterium]
MPSRAPKTIALLVFCVFVLGAPSANAKSLTFVLRGAGFGHGIGMSQYGAQGLASHGKSYKEILSHYYSGTSIGDSPKGTIRVILRQGVKSIAFSGAGSASGGVDLSSGTRYTVKRDGGDLKLYDGSKLIHTYSNGFDADAGNGAARLYGTAIGGLKDGRYRGQLEFSEAPLGGMYVVNAAGIDDYVQGVVPGEVPSSWRADALRAQAVAARSYALTTDAGGALFDQYPDTRSQVYRGVSVETDATNKAVSATAGEVVKYKGKVATTFFFSTSGGRTENIENVWYGSAPQPYLKSVKDPYDDISPYHRWTVRMSRKTLQSKLGSYVKGTLKNVKVVKKGVSPRVIRANVIGTRGTKSITGAQLRSMLGLRDTWVSFKRVTR